MLHAIVILVVTDTETGPHIVYSSPFLILEIKRRKVIAGDESDHSDED